jgi:hypothetical protein
MFRVGVFILVTLCVSLKSCGGSWVWGNNLGPNDRFFPKGRQVFHSGLIRFLPKPLVLQNCRGVAEGHRGRPRGIRRQGQLQASLKEIALTGKIRTRRKSAAHKGGILS